MTEAEAVRPAPLDIVLHIIVAGAAAEPLDDFIFSFAHKQASISTALNATILQHKDTENATK